MSTHKVAVAHIVLPSRRSVLAGCACATIAAPFFAAAAAAQFAPEDERFMRMALEQARHRRFSVRRGDRRATERCWRSGAISGARTATRPRTARWSRSAASSTSIRRAALRGTTLYTTGEPCAMCMGAILWCRIGRLVFAASVAQLATKIDQIMLSSADVAATAKFAPIAITGGVLADEAMALFK